MHRRPTIPGVHTCVLVMKAARRGEAPPPSWRSVAAAYQEEKEEEGTDLLGRHVAWLVDYVSDGLGLGLCLLDCDVIDLSVIER